MWVLVFTLRYLGSGCLVFVKFEGFFFLVYPCVYLYIHHVHFPPLSSTEWLKRCLFSLHSAWLPGRLCGEKPTCSVGPASHSVGTSASALSFPLPLIQPLLDWWQSSLAVVGWKAHSWGLEADTPWRWCWGGPEPRLSIFLHRFRFPSLPPSLVTLCAQCALHGYGGFLWILFSL